MIFSNRIIIDNKTKHRIHPPVNIPDRPSMFYDKALCEEFSKQFNFNFPKKNNKLLVKKRNT